MVRGVHLLCVYVLTYVCEYVLQNYCLSENIGSHKIWELPKILPNALLAEIIFGSLRESYVIAWISLHANVD